QIADMDPILELAARYDLMVIEDACQAHGAEYFSTKEGRWRKAGSMGRAAAFSFYPGKNLGACGEAGAVTTDDERLAQRCHLLRDHGQSRKYFHDNEGYNGRLDAIQAGLLLVKLRHLAKWNEQRRQVASRYDELFADADGLLVLPHVPSWSRPVYHLYVVRVPDRDGLQKSMTASATVVVVGLGEIGRPLLELVSRHARGVGVDVRPPTEPVRPVDIMHVCYPFEIEDFVGVTARYIERFAPGLTIVNSTVAVGTTRAIADRTGAAVVHSPIRGKHVRMLEDLLGYTKFVGPMDQASGKSAVEHFESLGMRTRLLSEPEATELAKLTETTYFGLLIAWAQEVERYCDRLGQDYN